MQVENYFNNNVKFINKNSFSDDRGIFIQSYDEKVQSIIGCNFVQENISISKKNVIRGLHYQWEKPMGKLIQCINGSIIDFVVDIRKDSETFGEIKTFHLNNINKLLWIPAGFAHGFFSIDNNTIVKYMCDALYNKDCEGAINVFDERFKILKILNIELDNLIVSDKDRYAAMFENYKQNTKF